MDIIDSEKVLALIQMYFGRKIVVNQNIYKVSSDPHIVINLSFFLEKEFEIEYEEFEWNRMKTVREVIELTLFKVESKKENDSLIKDEFYLKNQPKASKNKAA